MLIKRTLAVLAVTALFVFPLPAQENGEEGASEELEASEGSSAEIPSDVAGYISLDSSGTEALRIVDSGGDGVYARPEMSTVYLDVGLEYYIDLSKIDSEWLPLDIKGRRGEILISQREDLETFAGEEINASVEEDGIRFVLTEELAEKIAIFRAAPYPQMVGFIAPVFENEGPQEENEGPQEENTEEDQDEGEEEE